MSRANKSDSPAFAPQEAIAIDCADSDLDSEDGVPGSCHQWDFLYRNSAPEDALPSAAAGGSEAATEDVARKVVGNTEDFKHALDMIVSQVLFSQGLTSGLEKSNDVDEAKTYIIIKDSDISLRDDYFTRFLSVAAGACSLTLAECFVAIPPSHCKTADAYMKYLTPRFFNAYHDVDRWVYYITHKQKHIADLIDAPTVTPLVFVLANAVGTFMRKKIMDNPVMNAHTKFGSENLSRDITHALRNILYHLRTEHLQSQNAPTGTVVLPPQPYDILRASHPNIRYSF